ncbi:ABC transporter substrate-binding protein [Brucella pseudogrignonensis]|uniref:ABC transporter substrate-binding protein n=1 Tax=Brucella TaxID=234 RepID=UPI0028B6D994|nr:ABC transporter substrate-binding protein [Brucella pseudogrignonensis]MDT6939884.1 ABC transporter substrate-binding protein [Brucella pseudogrignonensis]
MNLKLLSSVAFAATLGFAGAAYADITVGVVAPLTGPVAAYGDQVKKGAETAVEVINANGGIKGEKIVLKFADDAGEPKQGVSAANQLVGEGVKFVVGPVTTGVAIPVSDVFAENGVLMVTPTATGPDLTSRGLETVFRTCGRDDQQADVMAAYFLKNLKDKKVAIVHDKGAYGKGLADSFKAAINKDGITEVQYDSVTPGDKDFSALVSKLKAAGTEVVYFGGYHGEGGLLARQLHDAGLNALILGGEGLSNTEFWAIGQKNAEGTLFTNAVDATKNPASKEAVDALTAKNIPVEAFTMNAYAAVQVLADGIERAGTTEDTAAVAKVLRDGQPIETVIGKLTYGETGDLSSPSFDVFKWSDGKIVGLD